MKIGVLGAGALGCAMGSVLSEAGHEVWLVNRRAEQVQAILRHGLRVREEGVDRFIRVHATTEPEAVGVVDLVIVLVKSFHTYDAMANAKSMVGQDTVVVSLQNGLGHEEILAGIVGVEHVLAGKTYAGGVMLGPGHVLVGTKGKETLLGELDGSLSPRLQHIVKMFNDAGLRTTASQNILGTMWDKLLVNVATGALGAVTRLTYGDLYAVPEIESCAVAAVAEAMAVARAAGITLSTADPRQPWLKAAAGLPPEFKVSMLQSLEKGSVTEIDYVNGAVVRWGAKHGVPTPTNQALVACVKGVERALLNKTANEITI